MPPGRPTLEQIYRNHRRDVLRLVIRRAPLAHVDDLVQDCFLAMHRTLASYDPSQKLLPWIKTVVIRTVRDFLELRGIRNELLSADGHVANCTESFEPAMIQRDLLDDLMASLTENERRVAYLVWVDGLGPDAIAEEIGVTPGHAITLRRRGLAKLQAALRRHHVREQRVIGERSRCVPAFALLSRATPWIDRARSLIFRLFARTKASIASLATTTGIAIAIGATTLPSAPPRAPPRTASLDSATTSAATTAAWILPTARAMPVDLPVEAPPPSPIPRRDPSSPAHAERLGGAYLLEQRSLEHIRITLDADPAAALAALERHKRIFSREHLREERQTLEDLARARLAPARRHADPRTDPRSVLPAAITGSPPR